MWKRQKQLSRGILRKRCSENMQQVYRRSPCRNIILKKLLYNQLCWNRTSAWIFSCEFAAFFQNTFHENTFGGLTLKRYFLSIQPGDSLMKVFTHVMSYALHIVTLKLHLIFQRYTLTASRRSRLEVLDSSFSKRKSHQSSFPTNFVKSSEYFKHPETIYRILLNGCFIVGWNVKT